MSERFPDVEAYQTLGKYDVDRQNDAAMEFFLKKGSQLYRTHFPSQEACNERVMKLNDEFCARIDESPCLTESVYEMSGPSVAVANITFESITDEDKETINGVQVTRDRAELMRPLDDFTTMKANFLGFSITPGEQFDEKGTSYFYAHPSVNFMTKQTVRLSDGVGGGTLLNITVDLPVVVPCDGNNEIRIPRLEQLKTRANALGQLALSTEGRGLTHSLNRLVEAFEAETAEFTPLKKPRILHEIANQSMNKALDHDLVATAIGMVIGRERPVRLGGSLFTNGIEETFEARVNGNVIDVLPQNPVTKVQEPTLVLEVGDSIQYAPLSRVTELEF